jgi:hypothetical protein
VAVIYDTSYLMSDRALVHEYDELGRCTVINIVPLEVQEEIDRHLRQGASQEKRRASAARGRVIWLKERATEWAQYQEPLLRSIASPRRDPRPLMPDSETDYLLVEFGKHLHQDPSLRAVVVASNDGGIHNLIFELRPSFPRLVFLSNPLAPHEIEPLRALLRRSAVIQSVSVEHAATVDGVSGIRLIVHFSIEGCQGAACNVSAFFFREDGQPLRTSNRAYSNDRGELALGADFRPIGAQVQRNMPYFVPYGVLKERFETHFDATGRRVIFVHSFEMGFSIYIHCGRDVIAQYRSSCMIPGNSLADRMNLGAPIADASTDRPCNLSPSSEAAVPNVEKRMVEVTIRLPRLRTRRNDELDLQLIRSAEDAGGLPAAGRNLMVVASMDGTLHFLVFDADGALAWTIGEDRLPSHLQERVADLKTRLEGLWPPHELAPSERDEIIAEVVRVREIWNERAVSRGGDGLDGLRGALH